MLTAVARTLVFPQPCGRNSFGGKIAFVYGKLNHRHIFYTLQILSAVGVRRVGFFHFYLSLECKAVRKARVMMMTARVLMRQRPAVNGFICLSARSKRAWRRTRWSLLVLVFLFVVLPVLLRRFRL